jgi:DNA-binding transcriptional ArsR family regulator
MKMTKQRLASEQAEFCRVFAHPRRILILWTLAKREKSVGEIATAVEASLQNTSQHLRLMREMGILDSRRDGQMILYHVNKEGPPAKCQLVAQLSEEAEPSRSAQ